MQIQLLILDYKLLKTVSILKRRQKGNLNPLLEHVW